MRTCAIYIAMVAYIVTYMLLEHSAIYATHICVSHIHAIRALRHICEYLTYMLQELDTHDSLKRHIWVLLAYMHRGSTYTVWQAKEALYLSYMLEETRHI